MFQRANLIAGFLFLSLALALSGCASVQKTVQKTIDSGKTVSTPVRNDFEQALKYNDITKIDRLIEEYPNLINPWVEDGKSIRYAIRNSSDTVVEHLFEQGIDPNGQNFLYYAALGDRTPVARMLIERGADVDGKEGLLVRAGPLHVAASRNNVELVELLLASGADVNLEDGNGMTALMVSILSSDESIGRYYREFDRSPDPARTRDVCMALLDVGADVTKSIKGGATALHFVRSTTDSAVARRIIDMGADVNAEAPNGARPIHMAAGADAATVVRMLLERGVDPNEKADSDNRPLHFAALGDAQEVVGVLVAGGADPEARTKQGYTPVQLAAEFGSTRFLAAFASRDRNAAMELGRIRGEEAFQKRLEEDLRRDAGGTGDPANCGLCNGTGQRMCYVCSGNGRDPSGRTLYCTSCAGTGRAACTHGR